MGSTTAVGDPDIHIRRFTDIEFASDVSYSDMRSLEFTSKRNPSGQLAAEEDIEEGRHGREEIELREM